MFSRKLSMETKIYRNSDADLSILEGKTIAMIGYGNQGRSQALNMRDQGLDVIVGNIDDDYKIRARDDGFQVSSIAEAVKRADALFFLIPDEIMQEVFEEKVRPFMNEKDVIVFASGYNIAFGLIEPQKNIDIILIAPRMIGIGVRETFLSGEGYFSFLGVYQDASGKAREKMLALAKGVGGLIKGGIEVTFRQEAVLDLFTEQGFGPALSSIMTKSVSIMKDEDVPEEAVIIELMLAGKMKYNYGKLSEFGLVGHLNSLNDKVQYGMLSRGIRYKKVIRTTSMIQKNILKQIESGSFAEEWEKGISKFKLKVMKFFASKIGVGKLEKRVRKSMQMPEVDLWAHTPYPKKEDVENRKKIFRELDDFKHFKEF